MIRISLIIPFYSVERFIRQCLDSVFRQNIPEAEYEVICVNDCSPDQSESIVLEFQNAHTNLHLVRHETNKKLGAARNTGLKAAKGKYVWFIDSDDFIKENCLKDILRTCENEDLDILHWSIQDNHEDWILQMPESSVCSGIDDLLNGSRDMTYPWNRVYEREFLLQNNLWFNDLWGGDVIHTIQALNKAKRIKNLSDCFYYYRIDNSTSDMHSPATANKVFSFSYVLGKALDEAAERLDPSLHPLMKECVKWRINQSFKPIIKLSSNEREHLYQLLNADNSLRSFVLEKADSKVSLCLRIPAITAFLHFLYDTIRKVTE